MFDLIRKEMLWEAWDSGCAGELDWPRYHLKTAQDIGVYSFLRNFKDKKLTKVGGRKSRLLKRLPLRNECYNIEKFEGSNEGLIAPKLINLRKNA